MDLDLKELQRLDPLKRVAAPSAKDMGNELSPMSPPEAFEPPSDSKIDPEGLHPFLKNLMNEHIELKEKLKELKTAFALPKKALENKQDTLKALHFFLQYFNQEFTPHNQKEESKLFPLLNDLLIQNGEHSPTKEKFTGIKILKDDHTNAIRLEGILSQLLKLILSLEHAPSKEILFNAIKKRSNELIDLMELHIFREDHIIFGMAQELLTIEQLDEMHSEFN